MTWKRKGKISRFTFWMTRHNNASLAVLWNEPLAIDGRVWLPFRGVFMSQTNVRTELLWDWAKVLCPIWNNPRNLSLAASMQKSTLDPTTWLWIRSVVLCCRRPAASWAVSVRVVRRSMAVKISPSTLWLWDGIRSLLPSLWFTSAKADIEKRVNQWGITKVFQKLACMSGQEKLWGRILSALKQRSTMRFYHCLQWLIAGDRDDEVKHCLLKTCKLLQGEFQLDIWKCFVLTVGSPESLWNFDPGRY